MVMNRSRSFLEKHKTTGRLAGIKARTAPRISHAIRVLKEIADAKGFHPELNFQQRPTIGVDAEKDYYDPVSKDRWNPQFREQKEQPGNKDKDNKDPNKRPNGREQKPEPPQGVPNNGRGNGPPEPPEEEPDQGVEEPVADEPGGTITRKELPDDPPDDSRKKVSVSKQPDGMPNASDKVTRQYSIEDDTLGQGNKLGTASTAYQIRQALKQAKGNRGKIPATRKNVHQHGSVQKYWS